MTPIGIRPNGTGARDEHDTVVAAKIVVELANARTVLKSLLGNRYDGKVADSRAILAGIRKKHECDALPALEIGLKKLREFWAEDGRPEHDLSGLLLQAAAAEELGL